MHLNSVLSYRMIIGTQVSHRPQPGSGGDWLLSCNYAFDRLAVNKQWRKVVCHQIRLIMKAEGLMINAFIADSLVTETQTYLGFLIRASNHAGSTHTVVFRGSHRCRMR